MSQLLIPLPTGFDHTAGKGQAIALIIGIVLMTWGIFVLLQPDWILDFGFL